MKASRPDKLVTVCCLVAFCYIPRINSNVEHEYIECIWYWHAMHTHLLLYSLDSWGRERRWTIGPFITRVHDGCFLFFFFLFFASREFQFYVSASFQNRYERMKEEWRTNSFRVQYDDNYYYCYCYCEMCAILSCMSIAIAVNEQWHDTSNVEWKKTPSFIRLQHSSALTMIIVVSMWTLCCHHHLEQSNNGTWSTAHICIIDIFMFE